VAHERILVVTAHPDDVDFGAAGSVARWVREGASVTYCIVTDGDAGASPPGVPRDEVPRLRRAEQTAAAKVLGVSDLVWLGYSDGQVTASLELRRDISRVIRQVRPSRVVCQSSERNLDRLFASHPDHLAAGEATICAVYPDARNPFAFPELMEAGLEPHVVEEVLIMAAGDLDHFVDITETFPHKVAALAAHVSQTEHHEDLEGMIRGWSEGVARLGGLPEGRLAEGFRRVETGERPPRARPPAPGER